MKAAEPGDLILEAQRLRAKIRRHERLYYVDSRPEVSDYEFDQLMRRLRLLEEEHPELITPDSPTHRVGGEPLEEFESHVHSVPMLSLDNCYSLEELAAFDERVRKGAAEASFEYVCELKIDGLSISLLYAQGVLDKGVTRGDGTRGDVVTANVKTIRSIPLRVECAAPDRGVETAQPAVIEVRGEVYMPRKAFLDLNAERERSGEALFANPRNSAAGTLRLLDPKAVAARRLDIFVYGLLFDGQVPFSTHWGCLEWLRRHGFKVNPEAAICANLREVEELTSKWEEQRESLEYEIDGAVIKVNQTYLQTRLGATSKFPRWATALKFQPRQSTTRLTAITVQVGRTGALTPVAELEPVLLGGSTVSRATLHNEDEVRRLDVRVDDYVLVEKGGDVIPKIVQVILSRRQGEPPVFKMPTSCPICNSLIFRPEGEVVSRCENPQCPARIKGALLHFASRRAMNIDGLGEALVNQLVDGGHVRSFDDLYHLTVSQLAALQRMGEKSAQSLVEEIANSKGNDFSRLLFGLGIRFVGERTAKILASHFTSVQELINASRESIESVFEIGPRIAESVHFFFQQKENQSLVRRLEASGVNTRSLAQAAARRSPVQGKQFVLTGALKSMSRDQARDRLEALGGRVISAVSRNTDYIIAGADPGSKLERARKLGIQTLTESEFLELLKS